MTNVFIVHGHAELQVFRLRNFLADIDVTPIVLKEQDDQGSSTLIEKFEYYARSCEVAIVLLTPDDELANPATAVSAKAARQNVMIELGWFMRHLGRPRVTIVHQEGTIIPSDIAGIVYLSFKSDVMEVTEQIRRRLRSLGIKLN